MEVTLIVMPHEADVPFQYTVGCTYLTQGGELVRVLSRTTLKGYECLECDDGAYRYDRSTKNSDFGRVTGTCHNYTDPRNFKRATLQGDEQCQS